MGVGCSNSNGKSGCDDRKGSMFGTIDDALARLYPTRTWGNVAAHEIVPPDLDLAAFAHELSLELTAPTFIAPPREDAPCDVIDILAVGRRPCAAEVATPPVGDEVYLRVLISQLAPLVAVQEVVLQIRDEDGQRVISEKTRAGVFSPALLGRMQRLVALLPAWDLVHLDFGDISAPPPGYSAGPWTERYGAAPALCNYFFLPEPASLDSQYVASQVATHHKVYA